MAQSQDSAGSSAPATDVSATVLARVEIRGLRPEDQATVEAITAEAFRGVSIDEVIEQRFGPLRPLSWQTIKSTAVGAEVREQAATCFVAELDGEVIGYITTAVSPATRARGRIPQYRHCARLPWLGGWGNAADRVRAGPYFPAAGSCGSRGIEDAGAE